METTIKSCDHDSVKVDFDKEKASNMTVGELRDKYPRFHGKCPDCGCDLIKYASIEHYLMGDW